MHYLSQVNKKEIAEKIVLLRIDLNIERGFEKDAFRLQTIIPTIKFLLKNKCKIVIISHRGRPEKNDKAFSLSPFAPTIAKLTNTPVDFIAGYRISAIKRATAISSANIVLIENLRFFKGEETNDPSFARELAKIADFYVNDAFPVCHRKNASVVAITKFLPSYAGLRLEEEIKQLDKVLLKPTHPLTIIIGGAKIADKLGVVKNFWNKADYFLFGGGPANTLLAAEGFDVGNSLIDTIAGDQISQILKSVRAGDPISKILFPSDFKKDNKKILDIGPKTIKEYTKIIKESKTIIWNGPMGLFENKKFADGTREIWQAIVIRCQMSNVKCRVIVGGGETTESLKLLDSKFYILNSRNVFLSTGGTAMLEYLSGKKLPGIEALK